MSTGFISCCLTRLDDALTTAGFEPALKTALIEAMVRSPAAPYQTRSAPPTV